MVMLPGADRSERHRFVRHYFEMVAAMIVGMMVVGGVVRLFCVLTGHEGVFDHAGASALIMATNMVIGMSVWMRYRHHSWAAIADMAGAMYVPLAVLIVPFWLGVLPGGALLGLMHVLMLPAMWLVMLRRPDEYVHEHRAPVGSGAHAN
jgi:flagellar biosynthetic protein FliP